jgi:hypothetical protein
MDAILEQLTAMQQQLEALTQQVSTLTGVTEFKVAPGAPKKRGRPAKQAVAEGTTPSATAVASAIEAAAPSKPKKVLSPEHLAKLAAAAKAAREAKKAAAASQAEAEATQAKEAAPPSV